MKQGKCNMLANEVRSVRSRVEQCLTGKLKDLNYVNETLTQVIKELEREDI